MDDLHGIFSLIKSPPSLSKEKEIKAKLYTRCFQKVNWGKEA
jgi:hypothetical protein